MNCSTQNQTPKMTESLLSMLCAEMEIAQLDPTYVYRSSTMDEELDSAEWSSSDESLREQPELHIPRVIDTSNRFDLLDVESVPADSDEEEEVVDAKHETWRIEPLPQEEVEDQRWRMRSFRYPGLGNVSFDPETCEWFRVRYSPAEERCYVEPFTTDDTWCEVPSSLEDAKNKCLRRERQHQRRERRREREAEMWLLDSAVRASRAQRGELARVRDIDRVGGKYYPLVQCRVHRCARPVVCDQCDSCLKHSAPRKCCKLDPKLKNEACCDGGVVVEEIRRRPRYHSKRAVGPLYRRVLRLSRKRLSQPVLRGLAQALFSIGVDVNKFQTEHVFKIPLVEELVATLKKEKSEVDWVKVITEVVFFFMHLLQGGFTTKNLALCLTHMFSNIGVGSMKWMWSKIMKRTPNAQSATTAMSVLATAIAAVISGLSLMLFSKLPQDTSIDKFIMRFSRIGQCLTSLDKVWSISGQASDAILDFIRVQLFGFESKDLREFEKIDKFCDEVQALNTPDFEKRCSDDPSLASTVTTLLQRGDEINKILDAYRIPAVQTQRFRASCLFLVRARDTIASVGAGTLRARVPPLVIHIHGGTGVGKSSMLEYLCSDLLVALGSKDPEDVQNKVYWRYPTSDFFDGYKNGTEITICDDFGSAKDSEVRPSPEPLEQIRMTNAAPFRPPMAHLQDKASTVFESKVIIWTSNRPSFSFVSLTNPEAVHNRVHLRFRQYPHPDFAKNKNINGVNSTVLDVEAVQRAVEEGRDAYRECMLFDMEQTEGTPGASGSYQVLEGCSGLTYEEMQRKCVTALLRRQATGKGMQAETRAYFAKRVAEKAAEAQAPPTVDGISMAAMAQADEDEEEAYETPEEVFSELTPRVPLTVDRVTARFFHQPGWIARQFGALYHLDVFGTIVATFGTDAFKALPYTPTEEEVKFLNAECIGCLPEHVEYIVPAIVECHRRRLQGIPCLEPLELLETKNIFLAHCEDHSNCKAKMSYAEACRLSMSEAVGVTTVRSVLGWASLMHEHPLLGTFATLLGTYVVVKALRMALSWVFSKIYEGIIGIAGAAVGSAKRLIPEGYSSGVKSAPTVKVEANGTPEAYPSGTVRAAKAGKVESSGDIEGLAESMSDVNAGEVRRKVFKNLYHIQTSVDAVDWRGVGSFTFISGRVGITNRHMESCLKEHVRLVCANGPQVYAFKKSDINIYSIPDDHPIYGYRDVAVWECPLNVSCHGSLTKFFMTKDDYSRHEELRKVCLVTYAVENGVSVPFYKETDKCRAFQREEFNLRFVDQPPKMIRNFYCYGLETQAGDCGGVLVAFDPRFNKKIVGIHMAGGSIGQGFTAAGVAVPQEMLKELISGIKLRWSHSLLDADVEVAVPLDVEADGQKLTFTNPIEGNFAFHGRADGKVYSSKKTAISPSPVADYCGPRLKKPAYLCAGLNAAGEPIDPVRKALNKACTPSVLVDRSALRAATADVKQMICNGETHNARTLTFEEAYRGIPGNLLYPAINRSTSPGYGWKKVGKGKTHWLGDDEFIVHADLAMAYNSALERLRQGKRLGAYWTDTMKDELRPIEKVEAGKTRLFSAGEMVQTILLRQFFMGFSAHLTEHMIEMESCVGVNAYSLDWTAIAIKLSRYGGNVVAGDFTNYDGTIPADVLWQVLSVINEFYGDDEENNKIRSLLWLEIVNSVHINGDVVYSWSHSQPSGCPFTSILNSVVHSIIVRVAYILAARKYAPEKANLAYFRKGVSHVNYGDDDVTNVSAELDWFNQISMAEAYATFGMTYTDETKTGELVKFRKLQDIQFLKRAFVWDEFQCRYRAPLDINTIKEMPCWNKTKGDRFELTALVLEDAVYELAQHPRAIWDEVMPMFHRARLAIAEHRPLRFSSYEEIFEEDALKYMAPHAKTVTEREFKKLCDRGLAGITVTGEAANPAAVGARPFGTTLHSEGGLFSPIGQCVPSIKSKLLARYALLETESSLGASIRLPTTSIRERFRTLTEDQQRGYRAWLENNPNKPTMCLSSWKYQDPRVTAVYNCVGECPCDFHGGEDIDMFRSLMNHYCDLQLEMAGSAQADNPDFAGGDKVVEQQEVMTFEEDGIVGHQDRDLDAPIVSAIAAPAQDLLTNDVKAFLRRPIHMKNFVWTSAQAVMSELFSIDFPIEWLNIPMVKEKLAGFRYLRGNIVVRLQINAQPMNAGALLMYLQPLAEQLAYVPSSTAHFGGITGYPHVIYRCGEETTVEFKLPFFPLVSHFDLTRAYGTTGILKCLVLSGLTGSIDCDGAVFVHMEDPVIDMPTGQPLLLSGRAQAGLTAERKRPGNVETATKALGNVAKSLKSVPVIGEAAGIADTVLSGVGAVASWFGWSKPIDPEYTTMVDPVLGRHMANYNGDSKPKVLALDFKNTCNVPTSVYNTTDDEMAFNTLLAKPIFADRFTFAATQAQGTTIYSWPVEPGACIKSLQTNEDHKWIQRQETMLSYLSTCAMYWRGEIKFHFKLVKTVFHSGRLRVTYVPGNWLGTLEGVELEKCYSQVYDIRERSDIEFAVPYSYFQPWKQTEADFPDVADTQLLKKVYTDPQGWIFVTVVNSLRAPSTVAQTIDILNFVSAGDDFQFAVPYAQPAIKIIPQAADVGPIAFSGTAQSRLFETQEQGEAVNANTIGEVFTGFRQWLKRYHPLVTDGIMGSLKHPFLNFTPTNRSIGDMAVLNFGAFARAVMLYRFQSGPIRIMIVNKAKESIATSVMSGAIAFDPTTYTPSTGQPRSENTYLEPLVELEVPFYQVWPALLTDVGGPRLSYGPDVNTGARFNALPYNYGTRLFVEPLAEGNSYYKAIGETFSFGFAIGPPVTFTTYTAS